MRNFKFLTLKESKKLPNCNFDNVVDTTGDTKLISFGFDKVAKNGKLILVGQPKVNKNLLIKNPLRFFNPPNDHVKILSSDGGLFKPETDMNKILKLINSNISIFKHLISHSIKFKDINKGIDLIKKGKAIRVLVNF